MRWKYERIWKLILFKAPPNDKWYLNTSKRERLWKFPYDRVPISTVSSNCWSITIQHLNLNQESPIIYKNKEYSENETWLLSLPKSNT